MPGVETKGGPNKETVAPRESLERGYNRLLRQRLDLGLDQVVRKGQGLQVRLEFEYPDIPIPDGVQRFVSKRYPGRDVDVESIEYYYYKSPGGTLKPYDPVSMIGIKIRPHDSIRSTSTELRIHDTPMTFGVEGETIGELDPQVVVALADMLPDQDSKDAPPQPAKVLTFYGGGDMRLPKTITLLG